MAGITLHSENNETVTCVPNVFIDELMADADGEYVKIYLYLLRCMNTPEESFSISGMADKFEHTEKDIKRALAYWEKAKVLHLEYDNDRRLTGICLSNPGRTKQQTPLSAPDTRTETAASAVTQAAPAPEKKAQKPKPDYTADEMRAFRKDKGVQELLFMTETYLNQTLNATDINTILYWHDSLGFSIDLIEYLIEYCVENGHKSMHYIQKVALSWADEHITTVDQARNSSAFYNKTCYSILNAFGIKGRGPASAELDYIRKWLEDGNFELDLILEACNRTISAIHQPSFEYTDKILENWKTGNVRTLADVERLDSAFEQEKDRRKTPSGQNRTPSAQQPSKFRNFEERSYNMDELTKKLLRSN